MRQSLNLLSFASSADDPSVVLADEELPPLARPLAPYVAGKLNLDPLKY